MVRTTVFRNNRTQAVRLPKAVALPDDVTEVEIRKVGRSRVITPVGSTWDEWFDNHVPYPDFPERAEQGVAEERDWPW